MSRLGRLFVPLVLPAAALAAAADRSYPVDCLPDRVAAWEAAEPNPGSRFGALYLPGIVLGPPGDSVPYQGATTVASLGFGGRAVLALDDAVIEDRPGPDFIVFENAFFQLPLPASAADGFSVFAEPGFVEASADGVTWFLFPYDAAALAQVPNQGNGSIDRALFLRLRGLAGVTPTFTGNWTLPDDPAVFDASGQGGVSGAGGDAFDLAEVGLSEARFVRITDADTGAGFAGASEGFDLDAVVVLHGRPRTPLTQDSDADRISDAEEVSVYGTNPFLADSDGDGVDDGREIASCRDPRSSSLAPFLLREPRLWLLGRACTEARFGFMGSGESYDLLRGDLASLSIDLGATICLVSSNPTPRWSCDADPVASRHAFFYLARVHGATDWGRDSALEPRGNGAECP